MMFRPRVWPGNLQGICFDKQDAYSYELAVRKLGVISGGSGSSKFVSALEEYLPFHPHYVANVGDNFWHYGLYICPDVDILMYTLAGRLDVKKGWGVRDDSFNFLKLYSILNPEESWFKLGDADLALCLRRTELIREGWNLSRITEHFRDLFKIKSQITPASDHPIQTFIRTSFGSMHLQEFWVKNKGRLKVTGVEYKGLSEARPNPALLNALSSNVLILPANPVSSILPTINLPQIRSVLKKAKVIAISPFLKNSPFSGPARKFMRGLGVESSSYGVAKLYSDFLRVFFVHQTEQTKTVRKIEEMGIECIKTNIWVRGSMDKRRIVNEIVQVL